MVLLRIFIALNIHMERPLITNAGQMQVEMSLEHFFSMAVVFGYHCSLLSP